MIIPGIILTVFWEKKGKKILEVKAEKYDVFLRYYRQKKSYL